MTHTPPPGETPDQDSPEYHLPEEHWPLPELSTQKNHPHPSGNRYVAASQSADYLLLRSTFRNFAFPIVTAVLVWYFGYVLLSTYAVAFMSMPAWGGLNVGFWLSFAQFPTTWIATWIYVRHAARKLDPLAAKIRTELEAEEAQA